MRRLGILLIFLILASSVRAQTRYIVYKCSDDITVNRFKTDEWTKVKRQDSLILFDMIKIPKGSSMVVLDTKNKGLYSFNGKDKTMSLKLLIQEASNKADNITATLNKELLSKSGNKEKDPYMQIAAAYRGENGKESYLDSLKAGISDITTAILDHNESLESIILDYPEYCSVFTGKAYHNPENALYFGFSNNSNYDLYVNVLYINPQGDARICYEFDYNSPSSYIFLPKGEEIKIDQYMFAPLSDDEKIVFFATTRPYDSHALQQLID